MARAKRKSVILDTARQRHAGLKQINAPNLGGELTVANYNTRITNFSTRLDGYNQLLAALDEEQNGIDTDEAELGQWNRRILSAGEAVYGADSSEYEMLGGKRSSERKRPTRRSTKETPKT